MHCKCIMCHVCMMASRSLQMVPSITSPQIARGLVSDAHAHQEAPVVLQHFTSHAASCVKI